MALWTYMFLKLGLKNEKYIYDNRPPKFNKNYRTRAARVKGFPEIKCFLSASFWATLHTNELRLTLNELCAP